MWKAASLRRTRERSTVPAACPPAPRRTADARGGLHSALRAPCPPDLHPRTWTAHPLCYKRCCVSVCSQALGPRLHGTYVLITLKLRVRLADAGVGVRGQKREEGKLTSCPHRTQVTD